MNKLKEKLTKDIPTMIFLRQQGLGYEEIGRRINRSGSGVNIILNKLGIKLQSQNCTNCKKIFTQKMQEECIAHTNVVA